LDWVNAISVKTTKQILGEIITKLFKFDNLDDPKLYAALSHLTTLWHKVVENKGAEFSLGDFVRYIDDCNKAELQILDANPYKNASDRVQVMSAHAAKGLEWEHVFILDASKQAWNNARTNNSDWPLPDNLRSIKNANADENGRKRLFYVAVTRAKTHLYISSSEQDFDGKRRERLDFLEDCVSCEPILMPEKAEDLTKKVQKGLELSWMRPEVTENLKDLLREKIADFHLSASALNTFLDIEHAGPTEFLMQNILHMPSAQSAEVMLGNAIHAAIDFWQKNKVSPDELRKFLAKYLETRTDIAPDKLVEFTDYGAGILENYLAAKALMFGLPSDSEVSLGYGGQEIRVGEARLVGKIDRLEFDENAKTITIVDFKTGKYPTSKSSAISRHKYTEQLYFYKILLELSGKYRNYQIIGGRLEYIKPDEETGGLPEPIEVVFEASIENRLRRLIGAVWKMISEVEFWSADEISARGLHKMAEFEEFLLEK
ncbi:MAG: PD-(D/E)XK nuclease family protein, partial [Candidatus Nomurabacteria bacterium]|jgi:DNA helicase-2/ATP-dependent DNA helicase PcrA|nr:PD-(D/E)XK nuclease family protein [Candidatus Nomurabacteria bacterium]